MTILAHYKNQQVEILDVYDNPGGKVASVKALSGRPFVGGDKWPVHTEYTTAPVAELSEINPQPETQSNRPNLLDLALDQARAQWPNGETVWIWRNGKGSAFLKAYSGAVCLHLTGYTPSLRVFWLDSNGWQVCRNVRADYESWASKAREALK